MEDLPNHELSPFQILLKHPFPDGPMYIVVQYFNVYEFLLQINIRLVCLDMNVIYCYLEKEIEQINIDFYKELMIAMIKFDRIDKFHNVVMKYRRLFKIKNAKWVSIKSVLVYLFTMLDTKVFINKPARPCHENCPLCHFCYNKHSREMFNWKFIVNNEWKEIKRCKCMKMEKYGVNRCGLNCPHSKHKIKIKSYRYKNMCIMKGFFKEYECVKENIIYKYIDYLLRRKYKNQNFNFITRLYFGLARNIKEYIFLDKIYNHKYEALKSDIISICIFDDMKYWTFPNGVKYILKTSSIQERCKYISSLKPLFGEENKKNIIFEIFQDWIELCEANLIDIPLATIDCYRYPELYEIFDESMINTSLEKFKDIYSDIPPLENVNYCRNTDVDHDTNDDIPPLVELENCQNLHTLEIRRHNTISEIPIALKNCQNLHTLENI
jgi:hypothetical protein